MEETNPPPSQERRDFLKKVCAIGAGTAAGLVPLGAGIAVLLDPLRRTTQAEKVFVTRLDSLPPDGIPRKFSVISSRVDAWTRFPNAAIGAVYLRRTSDKKIEALNVVCPHLGCFVDFHPENNIFFCPCHNSKFTLTGTLADKKSPSPRAMDSLDVELRDGNEVWVKFQNFKTGHPEKIPVA